MNPLLKQFHDNEALAATVEAYLVSHAKLQALDALMKREESALHLSTAIKAIEGAFASLREEYGSTARPFITNTR
jgi:hypothetical protein